MKSPYFFFDPIFAQPNSPGDLAKIVMLLGGGWVVRVPLILIGAAGTIYGYFWMGESAMHFSLGTTSTLDSKFRVGFILCVLPYLTNNLTLLAWFHPLGKSGFVATILKLWFGFLGFILAFMINFVWRAPSGPQTELTVIPQRLKPGVVSCHSGLRDVDIRPASGPEYWPLNYAKTVVKTHWKWYCMA